MPRNACRSAGEVVDATAQIFIAKPIHAAIRFAGGGDHTAATVG